MEKNTIFEVETVGKRSWAIRQFLAAFLDYLMKMVIMYLGECWEDAG